MVADKDQAGTEGMGCESYTKYPAEGAKVVPHGGNDAIHDAVRSEEKGMGNKVDPLSEGFGQ